MKSSISLNSHVILTAEADSLPSDAKQVFEDYGFVGCHSSRSNDLSVHARIDSTGYVRLLWESIEEDYELTQTTIFEVNFGKKREEALTDLGERTADTLFSDLGTVALDIEGGDLNITEDNFVPTARCIQDTKKRQLVTRSGLQRLRCCVCHLHHEEEMKAPTVFDTISKKYEKSYNTTRLMSLLEIAMRQHTNKYCKKQEYQDLYSSLVAVMLREMQRDINMGRPFEGRRHIYYFSNNHFAQLRSVDDLDCCFMAILLWRKPPGPRIMRKIWSNTCDRTQNKLKEQAEDSSYPKGIEVMLGETARKSYPHPEKP